ncbi:MAG: hypothetical protein WAT70_01430 [Rhizobiaceae bacterium]
MALDQDGIKAVQLLLKHRRNELQAPDKNRRALENYLNDNGGDLDRSDYAAVIAEAAAQAFRPGGAAAAASSPATSTSPGDGKGSRKAQRKAFNEELVQAPFRFIALSDMVVGPHDNAIRLDRAPDGLYSGSLSVEWIVETPLLVGGATKKDDDGNAPAETMRLGATGPWVLPGATLRGLVRSACEIVGHAKLARGNWHHRYGLRDFDHPWYMRPDGISDVKAVTAGFLTIRDAKDDDRPEHVAPPDRPGGKTRVWEIAPARWDHVPIDSLTADAGIRRTSKDWKESALLDKYAAAGMSDGRTSPDFGRTTNFLRRKVHRDDGREVVPTRSGGEPGVFCFSGKLPGGGNKKFEYALFRSGARVLPVPARAVEDFLRLHTTPSKNKLEAAFSWKDVHRSATTPAGVPVFMVGDLARGGDDFFFGLTRLFKIPHKYSIGDIVAKKHAAHIPILEKDGSYGADLVENLFGYVVEPSDLAPLADAASTAPEAIARRGRIAFGFALIDPATPATLEDQSVELIQMAPRASFAPYYLAGEAEKDYSGESARLAGRKTYLPRYAAPDAKAALKAMRAMGEAQIEAVIGQSREKKRPTNVISHLKFLMPASGKPLRFAGDIRLVNARPEEVGLLLFALTHGGDMTGAFRHMIGRARPFGAGQTRLGAVTLKLEANVGDEAGLLRPAGAAEKFDPATGKGLAGAGGQSPKPFLDAFVAFMAERVAGFPDVAAVREWLGAASPEEGVKVGARLDYRKKVNDFGDLRSMVKLMDPSAGPPPKGRPRLLPAPKGALPPR